MNQQTHDNQTSGQKSFDAQPHLIGDLVELRPLQPNDWDDLMVAASDPPIWEQHPNPDRYKPEVFRKFFEEALESRGALVAIDRESHKVIGSSRYHGYDPDRREVEIGWTFLARNYWGGQYNAEMKRLLLNHAFQFVENVVFFVGEENVRSQKAMEKIGAIKVGTVERTYGNCVRKSNVKYLIRRH